MSVLVLPLPPVCYLQSPPTPVLVVCFAHNPILQQVSVLSPFSSLPTFHQTSPAPAVWLKLLLLLDQDI